MLDKTSYSVIHIYHDVGSLKSKLPLFFSSLSLFCRLLLCNVSVVAHLATIIFSRRTLLRVAIAAKRNDMSTFIILVRHGRGLGLVAQIIFWSRPGLGLFQVIAIKRYITTLYFYGSVRLSGRVEKKGCSVEG
jgi:hypothetical protein